MWIDENLISKRCDGQGFLLDAVVVGSHISVVQTCPHPHEELSQLEQQVHLPVHLPVRLPVHLPAC